MSTNRQRDCAKSTVEDMKARYPPYTSSLSSIAGRTVVVTESVIMRPRTCELVLSIILWMSG